MNEQLQKIRHLLSRDIWHLALERKPRIQRFFIRQFQLLLLAIQGFTRNNCTLRASALTFYSLLAIVPVAGLAFGIAKGFGFEKRLEAQLLQEFYGQEEIIRWVINFAHSLLENTRGGLIAGVGVVILFWLVIKVLTHIELSFNAIWQVSTHRSWSRRFSDYLSLMMMGPVIMIMSSSATVFITTQITRLTEGVELLGTVSPLILRLLQLLPYALFWILFSLTYIIMPNTSVRLRSGIVAGILAGTTFQVAQWTYIDLQVNVARYNAIYGSFAALPLFFIWMQLSWLIVLFGAEYAHAHQNFESLRLARQNRKLSQASQKLLALHIMHLLARQFAQAERALTDEEIAKQLKLPPTLIGPVLHRLLEAGLIARLDGATKRRRHYQPARDIHLLTIHYVLDALEHQGSNELSLPSSNMASQLDEALKALASAVASSPANRRLCDL